MLQRSSLKNATQSDFSPRTYPSACVRTISRGEKFAMLLLYLRSSLRTRILSFSLHQAYLLQGMYVDTTFELRIDQ